jgi:hypothetical protein
MRHAVRPDTGAGGHEVVPDGWVVESAGLWRGRAAEVVYDPRRHDVMITDGVGHDATEASLRADGWERCAIDGRKGLWARDRQVAARGALARLDQVAGGVGHGGPAQTPRPGDRPEVGRGLGL